jgi:hypothetical protein
MPHFRFTADKMDPIEEPRPESARRGQDDAQHVHIWLDPPATHDRTSPTPRPRRQRDQEPGGAKPNELPIAALRRFDDHTGQPYWVGREANSDRMFYARQEHDGDLTLGVVQSASGVEVEGAGDADPGELETRRPPASASHDSLDPAFERRALADLQHGGGTEFPFAASRAFARQTSDAFAAHWKRRRR